MNHKTTPTAALQTPLTTMFGLSTPILSAPMAFAAGGKLAAEVSRQGGLGIIGGGYGDTSWLEEEIKLASDEPFAVGFITWSLSKKPELLTRILQYKPVAIMLSFGDPRPFSQEIKAANTKLICQCQTIAHVAQAVEAGADVVVAQGTEAGGHGSLRSLMTFIPEAADYLQAHAPNTVLVSAGGIADGRGLAASLMLGAHGVLIGTRFWASKESLVHPNHHQSILETDGDGTIRTTVPDVVRSLDWPEEFTVRVRHNAFTRRWHGQENAMREQLETLTPAYIEASSQGDTENAGVFFGEAAGLIHRIDSVETIMNDITQQALTLLTSRC
ncbi:NAD(P)H-dependent flavin oxidoreductase [Orrella sp. 11846]|uniref:NAD(P)H-dependent flavin oxidoreductase n=1 Tax=Orrella sp. 11846 TaxID=3409913 RepID=UPI003B591291